MPSENLKAWNFDANNRQKLPKDHVIPPPKLYHRDGRTPSDAEAAGVETTGRWIRPLGLALDTRGGLNLLDYFVDVLLPHFGDCKMP